MTVLIDTSIFFAFYSEKDVHHIDSLVLLYHAIEGRFGRPYITDHILSETVTLLKYRISPDAAMSFVKHFLESGNVSLIIADEAIIKEALRLFKAHARMKGFSFTDAVSVAVVKELGIDFLMTYDFSLSSFVRTIGSNYVSALPKEEIDRVLKLFGKT